MREIDDETIVYIVIEVTIALLSVIGNSLMCYVVMNNPSMRRKPMYMFLTSLAIADISVGTFAIPFSILTKLGLPHNSPYICIAMLTFIIIPTLISIFNLMTVSIERYIAIRHPLLHFNKLTQRLAFYLIVFTWIFSTLLGLIPLGWNNIKPATNSSSYENNSTTAVSRTSNPLIECQFVEVMSDDYLLFNFFVCFLSPLLVCITLYCLLFRSFPRTHIGPTNSRSHTGVSMDSQQTSSFNVKSLPIERINKQFDNKCGSTIIKEISSENEFVQKRSQHLRDVKVTSKYEQSRAKKIKKKREIHAAVVLALIVLMFAICWFPIHILNTIQRFSNREVVQIPIWLFSVAILLSHANSAVNFFLYSWRLRAFRRELNRKVLSKIAALFRRL